MPKLSMKVEKYNNWVHVLEIKNAKVKPVNGWIVGYTIGESFEQYYSGSNPVDTLYKHIKLISIHDDRLLDTKSIPMGIVLLEEQEYYQYDLFNYRLDYIKLACKRLTEINSANIEPEYIII